MSLFTSAIEAKRLELLHELVPKATAVGVLVNPKLSQRSYNIGLLRSS
jgi:putative tryptophan/tyrosine transport system substrate-binding protein